jgi:cobalt-zinc-cadmium efflux system membrane fusion protein
MMKPSTPHISKKHGIAIAVLVALGLFGVVAILRVEPATLAEAHEHGHDEDHADGERHGEKAEGHGHADEHADDEHHEEAAKGPHAGEDGRIAMSEAQVKAAGITLEAAAPASIRSSLRLPGEIRFNEDRTAHVVPRVAGVVESVGASLGQRVRQGQVLAVIHSATVSEQRSELQAAQKREQLARSTYEREKKLWQEKISPQQDVLVAEQAWHEAEIAVANARQKLQAIGAGSHGGGLNRYELRAPFDANVVEKHIALGELVKEDANVFIVSDLATVWAEVDVAAKDIGQVRVGEKVTVRSSASSESVDGRVAYVGALLGEQTRTAKARIVLANPKGAWRPGLFVTVELVTAEAPAAVTVASDAVQQLAEQPVVFVKVDGGFVPQPVELGRSDGQRVEVVKGLTPGSVHAAAGSFVVKSEAGKGSATHTH